MELSFYSYKPEFDYLEEDYSKVLKFTFDYLKLKCEPIISVSIIDNDEIHKINREYRNVDKETDVISFAFLDNDEEGRKNLKKKTLVDLGEIYISLPKAEEQAKEYGHSLKRELSFLFLHGLLHLLGYDHMNKEDETVMFSLQEEILTSLGATR